MRLRNRTQLFLFLVFGAMIAVLAVVLPLTATRASAANAQSPIEMYKRQAPNYDLNIGRG